MCRAIVQFLILFNFYFTLGSYDIKEKTVLKRVKRVILGVPALKGEFPFEVAIKQQSIENPNEYKTFCNGAIIKVQSVLTVANCFCTIPTDWMSQIQCIKYERIIEADAIMVHAGTITDESIYNKWDHPIFGQWRRVQEIIIHPGYDDPYEDIAILRLKKPFSFNDFVKDIPAITETPRGVWAFRCMTCGFGRTTPKGDGPLPGYLKKIEMSLHTNLICSDLHRRNMSKSWCMRESIDPKNQTDLGKGDEGAPVICTFPSHPEPKTWYLFGVAAKRRQGTWGRYYFTKTAGYNDFIKRDEVYSIKPVFELILCLIGILFICTSMFFI